MNAKAVYNRARAIFLALPGATEVLKWGVPHICVGKKILGQVDLHDDDRVTFNTKLDRAHAAARVRDDARCKPAQYTGHAGWIEMDITDAADAADWALVRALIEEGYRLIAPKKLSALLAASPAGAHRVRGATRNAR